MKFKNISQKKAKIGNKFKRTSKSNLTKGAFGVKSIVGSISSLLKEVTYV